MTERKLTPLTDPTQVPTDMTEAEARAFWDSHEITEAYLEKAEEVDDDGPPTRTPVASRSISLRLESDTLQRLKDLASRRRMGYQTLLKNFVLERLYEEEKRERQSRS